MRDTLDIPSEWKCIVSVPHLNKHLFHFEWTSSFYELEKVFSWGHWWTGWLTDEAGRCCFGALQVGPFAVKVSLGGRMAAGKMFTDEVRSEAWPGYKIIIFNSLCPCCDRRWKTCGMKILDQIGCRLFLINNDRQFLRCTHGRDEGRRIGLWGFRADRNIP